MASKNFTLSQVGNILNAAANGVVTGLNSANYVANLGPVGNVTITGGSNGQVLSTDGSGVLSWSTVDTSNAANANYSAYAGNITIAAQPNITSLGTLTALTVGGSSNLGAVGNVTITGGSNGQALTTNGNGTLSWSTVGGGSSSISPDFSASLGNNQQWAGGGWSSAILFNVVDYNTGNAYNATTGKFTATIAGLYQVEGGLRISAVFGTNLQNIIFGIYKNNTKLRDISDQTGTMSSAGSSEVTTLRLAAGDAIDWRVYTAGGPTNVLSGSVFTVRYVGTP